MEKGRCQGLDMDKMEKPENGENNQNELCASVKLSKTLIQ